MFTRISLVLGLMFFVQFAGANSSDHCGPIIPSSIHIAGDHGSDWVTGASIKIKTWVRVTETKAPKFTEALTKLIIKGGDEEKNKQGLFACLDEYQTEFIRRHKYATVTKFRIWQMGQLVPDVSTSEKKHSYS